jgi:hypothetical protein
MDELKKIAETNNHLKKKIYFCLGRINIIKPGTLGDRSKSMTIRLDSNAKVDNRCYRVTDASFAVGGRHCIG